MSHRDCQKLSPQPITSKIFTKNERLWTHRKQMFVMYWLMNWNCVSYSHMIANFGAKTHSNELLRPCYWSITVDATWIHHITLLRRKNGKTVQKGVNISKTAKNPLKTAKNPSWVMANTFWDSHGIVFINYLE